MTALAGTLRSFDLVLQTRGVGAIEGLRAVLPRWAVEAFAAATHLGDTAVLVALATLVYLAYDRQAGAFVLGALLAAFGVIVALKALFAAPRPPAELQVVAESGFGFPSGHALDSTVAWGAMAVAMDRLWDARRRFAVAGVVVAAVALSRVVIGVHYLVDVVVGVAVGLVVLGVAARWLREEPLQLFGLGAGLAVVAVAVSGASVDAVALLGATVGGVGAWQVAEPEDRPFGRRGPLAAGGVGVVVAAGAVAVDVQAALAFAAAGLTAVAVILAPLGRERWLEG